MIKKLWPCTRGYRKWIVLGVLCSASEAVFELLLPLVMADIVDTGIPAGYTSYILARGALMVAMALMSMALGVCSAFFSSRAGQGFGANLRRAQYDHIQTFSFRNIEKFSTASLVTRLTNDCNMLQMSLMMGMRLLVRAPVMLVSALVLAVSIAVSKVPVRSIVRGLKPVLFIVVFTAVLNLLYTPGDTVLAQFWIFTITLEGVWRALFMVIRIMMLISGTFLLTYTTSPILLTDGLESLLNPLKKIRVPVHELAMMMSIALRFIPTLIEETDKIMSAQRARGADFESGSLIQRAKALLPLLVPLFISAFRRADELATAMECRCYHGGEGRTKLKVLRYRGIDYTAFSLGALILAGVIVLARFGL